KSDRPRLRLSMKALSDAPAPVTIEQGQVLVGTVSKIESYGIFVDTPKGTGLVPTRELGLPRGADARRAFPIGEEVRVVTLGQSEGGRLTLSIGRVAGVEERQNYRDFAQAGAAGQAASLGTFADLMRG